jgi:hypothetical protein
MLAKLIIEKRDKKRLPKAGKKSQQKRSRQPSDVCCDEFKQRKT